MYGNTQGFIGCYPQSLQTINCGVVAQSGKKMQSDHEYTTARSSADLDNPVMIAKQAAQKVLQRLDTRRLTTTPLSGYFSCAAGERIIIQFYRRNQWSKPLSKSFIFTGFFG